jgi:hypothetical protein
MLNGISPILIFSFKELIPTLKELTTGKIPLVYSKESPIILPLIPLYLDEKLFGIYIENESRNIEIDTEPKTLPNETIETDQRALLSSVTINMVAKRDSVGMIILMAMTDFVFPKLSSKNYSVTYLNGAMTMFNGLLHSFSIDQNTENDLYKISMQISSGKKEKTKIKSDAPVAPSVSSNGIDMPPPS